MKLYEVNEAIDAIFDEMVDPETGEILVESTDEYMAKLGELEMEKGRILEYLAKLTLNLRSDQAALKAEEGRLKERREKLARKEARLMDVLDRECAGEKTDLGVATVSYRKTSRVEVTDEQKAVDWLFDNDYDGCYRIPAPEIAKTEVKKLITSGVEVPGCSIVEGKSCSLR